MKLTMLLILISSFVMVQGRSYVNNSNGQNKIPITLPLKIGNRWKYSGEAIIKDRGFTFREIGSAQIFINDRSDENIYSMIFSGSSSAGNQFYLEGGIVKSDIGLLVNALSTLSDDRGIGFLLPSEVEIGDIITAKLLRNDPVSRIILNFQRIDQVIHVPIGVFNNAIEIKFAADISNGRAIGRIYLVPDIGIPLIEGIFNERGGRHGTFTIKLNDIMLN